MDIFEGNKKIIVTLIVIYVIVSICIIIYIWIPRGNNNNILSYKEYSDDEVYEKFSNIYFNELSKYILTKNYDKIYSLLNENYIDDLGITKSNYKEYLDKLGIFDNKILLKGTQAYKSNSNIVYILTCEIGSNKIDINVIETTPYLYTISFGDKTYEEKIEVTSTNTYNNVLFNVKRTDKTKEYIEYEITILNENNPNKVNIDLYKQNSIVLESTDDKIYNGNIEYPINSIVLSKGESKTFKIKFLLNSTLQSATKKITFNDFSILDETESVSVILN